MSDFERIVLWFFIIIAWFIFYGTCMSLWEQYNINPLYTVFGGLAVIGGIVWLIYHLSKKHKEKVRARAAKIRGTYPNAYRAYKADNHIEYKYLDESVASIPDGKWEKMEKDAKELNVVYDKIRNTYKIGFELWSKKNKISNQYWASETKTKIKKFAVDSVEEIIKNEKQELESKWPSEQNDFSSHCRDLRDEIFPSFGCYVYKYELPINLFGNSVKVWQMFPYAYCLDKTIDYTLEKACFENAELIAQHKWQDIHSEIKTTCDYINKLYDEERVSLYFNFQDGWKENVLIDIMETFGLHLNDNITQGVIYINSSLKRFRQSISNTSIEDWVNKIRRRVVIIDLAAENDELLRLCEDVTSKAKVKYPLITVVSLYKCFSSDEMKEIIEKDRQEAEAKKKEEEERLRKYRMLPLDEIPDIDNQPHVPDVPTIEYEKGVVITDKEIIRVNYDIQQCVDNKFYSYYTAPTIYNVVFPYRRRKTGLRGYTELKFENRLRKEFKNIDNYEVLGDVSIMASEGYQPYEPDIAIVEKTNKYGLRIDIEIDEPYSGYDREPIHYLGCGDEFRDKNLSNLGWLVIRFSESQIFKEPYACICYIKQVVSQIDSSFLPQIEGDIPHRIRRWSEFDAKCMILYKEREKMLQHEFGQKIIDSNTVNTEMSEYEKKVSAFVNPLYVPTLVKHNLDDSIVSFPQDSDLQFEPNEHIYIYKGHYTLDAISSVVNKFFKPFESFRISFEKSMRKKIDQGELLEEWNYKGQYAREIGTFMHSQIEAYFSHQDIKYTTHFVYNGLVKKVDEVVSIEDEIEQFKEFLSDNPIKPFRTEWHIFDPEYKIAGTIDLLCRNGNKFDIYDWKRSYRASPYEVEYSKGINGLEHIPDIAFYHYALQQNLYKYILEKNYNIKISNMYIVVLHTYLNHYELHKIPNLDNEIRTILKYIGQQKGIINDLTTAVDKEMELKVAPSAKEINNHEYVDLGLSVKWATCNIGASCAEELGDFYAWGEISSKESYDWKNYRFWEEGDIEEKMVFSKYKFIRSKGPIGSNVKLEKADDAAYVKWGSTWHIPTWKDFKELQEGCIWEWCDYKGVLGYKVSGKKSGYTNNYIFLPASGSYKSKERMVHNSRYWANGVFFDTASAEALVFKSDEIRSTGVSRFIGCTIRPVCL